jgi:hypothetical protein
MCAFSLPPQQDGKWCDRADERLAGTARSQETKEIRRKVLSLFLARESNHEFRFDGRQAEEKRGER